MSIFNDKIQINGIEKKTFFGKMHCVLKCFNRMFGKNLDILTKNIIINEEYIILRFFPKVLMKTQNAMNCLTNDEAHDYCYNKLYREREERRRQLSDCCFDLMSKAGVLIVLDNFLKLSITQFLTYYFFKSGVK